MKKSDIYKYALAAAIKDIAAENNYAGTDIHKTYEIVSELCRGIDLELFKERRQEENGNGNG